MQFEDSVERIDRHQVQGRQLVLGQIEVAAFEKIRRSVTRTTRQVTPMAA